MVLLAICSFASAATGPVLLALGMGLQNSAANGLNGMALNQVFITGSLQKLGEEIVHRPWPRKGAVSHGLRIFAGVWLGYAIGALVGALASTRLGAPLLLPPAILPFMMMGPDRPTASHAAREIQQAVAIIALVALVLPASR